MDKKKAERATLALEDGTLFPGRSVGASGERVGEVCFNTSLSGYQEILTDPSYSGQIVTMTCPQIGNVGVNGEDSEAIRPHALGFVMREYSRVRSNWRAEEDLASFLVRFDIPAIDGIDTRRLTRILREKGAQRGVLSTLDHDPVSLVTKARAWSGMAGLDLASRVTCASSYPFRETVWELGRGHRESPFESRRFKVAVLDYGVKRNILRNLVRVGCDLVVHPGPTAASAILQGKPDGIFLSNGPGDPAAVTYAIDAIREFLASGIPLFGICLGHQMLCLALGAECYKMKFGHRGGNHPVQDLATGNVEVTAQNHGFVVREESLPDFLEPTHRSLFDGTLEGVRHREKPAFSVQFHPEASPGPHDSRHLFDRFAALMRAQGRG